jgi:hypothetical protein
MMGENIQYRICDIIYSDNIVLHIVYDVIGAYDIVYYMQYNIVYNVVYDIVYDIVYDEHQPIYSCCLSAAAKRIASKGRKQMMHRAVVSLAPRYSHQNGNRYNVQLQGRDSLW